MDGTLSAWLKAAGVEVHRRSGGRSGPPPDGETLEHELARLRARVDEWPSLVRRRSSALPDLGPAAADLTASFVRLHSDHWIVARCWPPPEEGTARPGGEWATAMHEACWAAHLSGRTRTVGAAHLLAVQLFIDAGLRGAGHAGPLCNVFAGFHPGYLGGRSPPGNSPGMPHRARLSLTTRPREERTRGR
jgi:transposase